MESYFVEMTRDPILLEKSLARISADEFGAVNFFMGVVRNLHAGKTVTGITYDAHEGLAKKTLEDICREAQGMWGETKLFVAHYIGYLPVGGASVLIGVSSPHREESFEACRYIIEEIKERLPVWKKEHYIDGTSGWLPGHSLKEEAESADFCCGSCS